MIDDFSIEELCCMEDSDIANLLQNDIDFIIMKVNLIRQRKKELHETELNRFFYKEDENDILHFNNINSVISICDAWVSIIDIIKNDLIPKEQTLKLFEEFIEYYNANENWLK